MRANLHREEILLVVLAATEIPLDPESIAATYDTPVAEWRIALQRLRHRGDVEEVGDGLYRLTKAGQEKAQPRGGGGTRLPLPDARVAGRFDSPD